MKPAIFLLFAFTAYNVYAQPPDKRVVQNDPSKYRQLAAVHAGAGQMKFAGLIGSSAVATNFLYLHAGENPDKGSIGQHFHHTIEEMYTECARHHFLRDFFCC